MGDDRVRGITEWSEWNWDAVIKKRMDKTDTPWGGEAAKPTFLGGSGQSLEFKPIFSKMTVDDMIRAEVEALNRQLRALDTSLVWFTDRKTKKTKE